jgi:hypothetical protein
MSDLSRREAMKRAAAAGVVASGSTLLGGAVRAENNQGPAREGQPGTGAAGEKAAAATSNHVPISIFIHGRQQIQLTGQKIVPGGPSWGAKADDPSIVQVTAMPSQIAHFPVKFWELTVTGLKIGKTQVHVQEVQQATHPPTVLFSFVLDVTVLGLLE